MGGLHRSGTTPLGRILSDHPDISGFQNTGAKEDEGQHLQSVYPAARKNGGPGRFARRDQTHLIETSKPPPKVAGRALLEQWTPYWDVDKPLLVEKSPPNLIMGRWLQKAFPGSALIVIIRHPVVVALSTKKWARRTSLPRLVDHWFVAHALLEEDAQHLQRLLVIRYEDLVTAPERTLESVAGFLNLSAPLDSGRLQTRRSSRYVQNWAQMAHGTRFQRFQRSRIERDYAQRVQRYGYSVEDLDAVSNFDWPPTR